MEVSGLRYKHVYSLAALDLAAAIRTDAAAYQRWHGYALGHHLRRRVVHTLHVGLLRNHYATALLRFLWFLYGQLSTELDVARALVCVGCSRDPLLPPPPQLHSHMNLLLRI